MPSVKVRGGVLGYPRHARAHAYTSYKRNDRTHLHSSGFDSKIRMPETTCPPIMRTVGNERKGRQNVGVRPVPPGVLQHHGVVALRVVRIWNNELRPAVVDQAIRLHGRRGSRDAA